MRKNFGAKPILYPQPVLMIGTYNEDGTPDLMAAAWGGITGETEVTISVDSKHKTAENLLVRKAFTVSAATEDHLIACDYVGIVSGKRVPDKVARAGFHIAPSAFVDAPLVDELPVALECRLIRYDADTSILVGEIVNVCADEQVLTDGKIDPSKLRPLIHDEANRAYWSLGRRIGNTFHDGIALK